MSLPPANWYADPSDSTMLRYWDGGAWTGHTQANVQPTFQANVQPTFQPTPPQAFQPLAPVASAQEQGYGAIGARTVVPAYGHVMTPGVGSNPSTYSYLESTLVKRSKRGLWWGLGVAGVLGLALVAAVIGVILPKFSPLSSDYTGAPVTASDVAPEGKTLAVSSTETVAIEIPQGWVDAGTYIDLTDPSVGLPEGTEWLGVWFTGAPNGTNPPEMAMVAEVRAQATGPGSLSDFQNQAIGGARASGEVASVGNTTDVTLANGLEGKQTTVVMDMGDDMTATMVVATFGHGRRLAMVMWVSYSGAVDDAKAYAFMESLRIDS